MKKNIKKFIPAIMITTMLASSAVFADDASNSQKTENSIEVEANQNINSSKATVVELIQEGENLLLPVRTTFESLGFEINYEPVGKIVTLTKGPVYVTFSTTKDAYTFARTAPQKLGQAPIVKDGSTYVPVTLLTDIMQMEGVTIEGLTLTIEEKKEEAKLPELKQTIITEIDEEKNTITVEDSEKGTIILNSKDLKIEYTTDEKVLSVGQAVEVEYGDIMTASQPPMNTPKSLKVVQKYNIVEVLSVEKDEKENTRVLVKDSEMGEVMLIISKETKMEGLDDISAGQILKVAMSSAMTMSIPPQTFAKEIHPVSIEPATEITEQAVEAEASEVEVISIDKENKQITVKDAKLGEVVLNMDGDVQIISEDSSNVSDNYEFKVGQKLSVVYGPAMTRSLPPINSPVKLTILK